MTDATRRPATTHGAAGRRRGWLGAGGIQVASPIGFRWLDPATVFALELTLIAAVYIVTMEMAHGLHRVPQGPNFPTA